MVNRIEGTEATLETYTGKDGRFRPCKHVKKTWKIGIPRLSGYSAKSYIPPGTSPTDVVYAESPNSEGIGFQSAYGPFYTRANSMSVSIAGVDWEANAIQALSEMLPAVGGDNSIINSILELADFRRIFNSIGSRGLSIIETLKKGLRDSLYDRPAQRLASANLEYSFAWAPLKREITSMFDSLWNFNTRIQALIDRAETPQQRYYGTSIPGTGSVSGSVLNGDISLGYATTGTTLAQRNYMNARLRYQVSSMTMEDFRYHATVRYRYTLPPGFKTAAGQAKSMLDVLGYNANPAILWNAIPFSFVIDWFVNVGKFLDGLRVENNPIKSEILEFSHSVRAQKRCQLSISSQQYGNGTTPYWDPYVVSDHCAATVYERRTGVPNLRLALLTSGLDLREAVLTASYGIVTRGRR